ncbi:hypothetical protein F383_32446 [Gossypium arboreum]|uniref:Uncharacterized protein n=2 Tax=Gossypium TaxID=3633 RepID=A0A0B0MVE8_GOSAR|nr:hypothetical protein F383_32446 [Gossypium arboreum]TYH28679.1 hypothetical protein ES288_A02G163100v1 [Gossypium darwinii]
MLVKSLIEKNDYSRPLIFMAIDSCLTREAKAHNKIIGTVRLFLA